MDNWPDKKCPCGGPIPRERRFNSVYCSTKCRERERSRRRRSTADTIATRLEKAFSSG